MNWEFTPFDSGSHPVAVRSYSAPTFCHQDIDQDIDQNICQQFRPEITCNYDVVPLIDVMENEEELRIDCELPGLVEDSIEVVITGNTLSINGSKSTNMENYQDVYINERKHGRFSRLIELPLDLDLESSTATFEKGVLSINIAKLDDEREHEIPISGAPVLPSSNIPAEDIPAPGSDDNNTILEERDLPLIMPEDLPIIGQEDMLPDMHDASANDDGRTGD